ncbi:hypothetical protein GCM10009624_23730 [Gordonia sinesedis]
MTYHYISGRGAGFDTPSASAPDYSTSGRPAAAHPGLLNQRKARRRTPRATQPAAASAPATHPGLLDQRKAPAKTPQVRNPNQNHGIAHDHHPQAHASA